MEFATSTEADDADTKSIIQDLLEKPFETRPFSEKLFIIQNGRPCPRLSNLKSVHKDRKREYTRYFKETQFALYPWLAGCKNQGKLYCWPCLLFSQFDSAWSSSGVDNLNALTTLQKKHKQSLTHLQCALKLARYSGNTMEEDPCSHSQLRDLNTQHNIQVRKSREVFKRLIDVICFLTNQELSFGSWQKESVSSLNRGNYIELINLLKQYDHKLRHNFETAATFNATSLEIKNDLIKAIGERLNIYITQKIEQAEFLAIMLDKTSVTHTNSHVSVSFRYYFNKKIHETFVGFIDVSSGQTAEDLSHLVAALLGRHDVTEKVVAQTHDAASGIYGNLIVESICPRAVFVHCYAQVINSVLAQGLANVKECRNFFSALDGIATFASNSNEKPYALKVFLKRQIPSLAANRWSLSSRLAEVVCTCAEDIQEFFESIQYDESGTWECNDRMAATGYCEFLKSFETVFLLNVFSKLFSHSDKLFKLFQSPNIDIVLCSRQIKKQNEFLELQRTEGFREIWELTLQKRKTRKEDFEANERQYRKLFLQIVDNLQVQMTKRFAFFEKLQFFDLLNGNKFSSYRDKNNFPGDLIKNLIETYPDTFEFVQLKNELTVFYENTYALQSAESSRTLTAFDVLLWLEEKQLDSNFEQVYKLSKLICTIPVSTVGLAETTEDESVETAFCVFERIKSYLKGTECEDRLSYLSLMSIEKEFLMELKESDDFYDRVIEKFLTLAERPDFMYR